MAVFFPFIRRPEDVEPKPPTKHLKMAEHHWLEKTDSDGHTFGAVVLQWCPGAGRWAHSGNVGTGMYVDTTYWTYMGYCPIPTEFPT